MKPLLVVIAGPTAVGKTRLSISLAKSFNCPVISSDSRQFYNELSIGTAKPPPEEIGSVPHFFIGHLSIHDYYNVSRFEQDVVNLFISGEIKVPVVLLTGGSGLYIDAVCKGIDDIPDPDPELRKQLIKNFEEKGAEYFRSVIKSIDPETYANIDLKNKNRLIRAVETIIITGKTLGDTRKGRFTERPFRLLKIALDIPRNELHSRINARVDEMVKNGLVNEVRGLYHLRHLNALNTVGYKEFFEYFDGKVTHEKAVEQIKANTRKYARRQLSWLRRDKQYKWFHPDQEAEIISLIKTCI